MANPTQKNSLISTVPLFSKSDKKWRKYRKICYFGIGISAKTIRYSQGWVFAMAKSIFARTVEKTGKTGKNWNIQNCTKTPQFG